MSDNPPLIWGAPTPHPAHLVRKRCVRCRKSTQRITDEGFMCWECDRDRVSADGTEMERKAISIGGFPWQKHGRPRRVYVTPADVFDVHVTVSGHPMSLNAAHALFYESKMWVEGDTITLAAPDAVPAVALDWAYEVFDAIEVER